MPSVVSDAGFEHAVILVAGQSTRLRPLIRDLPKALLTVDGRTPLLVRSVNALKDRGVERVTVVVGYQQDQIMDLLGDAVSYVVNPFFAHCNNLGSLWFARSAVGNGDFVYLHGDLIFDPELLDDVLATATKPTISLVVDFGETDAEAMKIRVDGDQAVQLGKDLSSGEAAGEWIGLAALSGGAGLALFEAADQLMRKGALEAYDVSAFNLLDTVHFNIVPVGNRRWREIDDERDLRAAQALFAPEMIHPQG
jgi:choline kinase